MRVAAVVAVWLVACGDDAPRPAIDAPVVVDLPPDAPGDIAAQLAALSGVTVVEWIPPMNFPVEPGYRFFDLEIELPIDHQAAGAGMFVLHASLQHRDVTAPLVVYTSGYEVGWRRFLTEPADLLAANQLSLEYRYYGASKPSGAIDWTKLTVAQSLADQHAIIGMMTTIFTGAVIATGGSKGGENVMAYAHAYPGDLDGVVAYVAPVITSLQDERYAGLFDRIGLPDCKAKLRAAARELLLRRANLEPQIDADPDASYTHVGIAHAYETAVVELEFSFWMTRGETECGAVPDVSATDAQLANFLTATSPPDGYSDEALASSGMYLYQNQIELGYPVWTHDYLTDLMQFSYEDWSAYYPTGAPTPVYDASQPLALAQHLATAPVAIMHVGGEWDPWGAGYATIETTTHDAFDFSVARGTHWSSGIYALAPAEQASALATLQRWAGVSSMRAAKPPRAPIASRELGRAL